MQGTLHIVVFLLTKPVNDSWVSFFPRECKWGTFRHFCSYASCWLQRSRGMRASGTLKSQKDQKHSSHLPPYRSLHCIAIAKAKNDKIDCFGLGTLPNRNKSGSRIMYVPKPYKTSKYHMSTFCATRAEKCDRTRTNCLCMRAEIFVTRTRRGTRCGNSVVISPVQRTECGHFMMQSMKVAHEGAMKIVFTLQHICKHSFIFSRKVAADG